MNRRRLLALSALGLVGTAAWLRSGAENQPNKQPITMTDTLQLDPNPITVEPFELSKDDWKARLDEEAFYVLRKEGTERPFTSH